MGSFQASIGRQCCTMMDNSCGYLLQELRMIWNEVGEDQFEREKVLLDIEQECLEVYRRKVDAANTSRAHLHQELAEAEAQLTHLLLSLGERALPGRPEKMAGTLKEQLDSITPALREMKLRKDERVNQFRAILGQIQKISSEIAGESEYSNSSSNVIVNENDLSLNKLEEYHLELQRLLNEKNERLQILEKHIDAIHNLAAILGMDSSMIITKVHPSLNELCGISKNISDNILHKLTGSVKSLEEEKNKRLEKLHYLGRSLINLWNLMDTRYEDRRSFSHVTGLLSISAADVSNPGSLAQNIILQTEAEVNRLDQLKAIKTRELFLKKQNELEEICNKSHMEIPSRAEMDNITILITSGEIDHTDLLASMDEQISRAKQEALSRKAIMEKVEKWILARDEERWLEEYNRDENRYTVSRGSHRHLRRAERARITVNKIPELMEILTAKTKSWEEERKKVFLYDEVPLLAMFEQYNALIKEKEEEKQRQKEKKKVQSPVTVKQEHTFGSRPSTSSRRPSDRSLKESLMNSTPIHRSSSARQHTSIIKEEKKAQVHKSKTYFRPGLFSHLKDETASVLSTFSGPLSP